MKADVPGAIQGAGIYISLGLLYNYIHHNVVLTPIFTYVSKSHLYKITASRHNLSMRLLQARITLYQTCAKIPERSRI